MRVILNSDILHDQRLLVDRVTRQVQPLLNVCRDDGHIIVIPLTALLEFARKQSTYVDNEVRALERAYGLLDQFHIQYVRVEPSEIIKEPDLVAIIKNAGVTVVVENPTLADFEDAHRRACLHECPQPPQKESDEMRDLVIWAIAIRLASSHGGAILISRDEVHTNELGDHEASSAHLERFNAVPDALEYLGVQTPGAQTIRQVLTGAWTSLVKTGLPFNPEMKDVRIYRARFVQGEGSLSGATAHVEALTETGSTLDAEIQMSISGNVVTQISLADISIASVRWSSPIVRVDCDVTLPAEPDDHQERLATLRATIGGQR
jgi:hypothetical protein